MSSGNAPFVNLNLPTQATLVASTEAELLNTTKMAPNMSLQTKDLAEYTYRGTGSIKWKRAFVSIYGSDQDMTLFVRNLSKSVASPAANGSDWIVVPDGAGSVVGSVVTQGAVRQFSIPLFGDDTKISVKPGATPPSVFRVDIVLTEDQALNG